jgi:hypothetical protein
MILGPEVPSETEIFVTVYIICGHIISTSNEDSIVCLVKSFPLILDGQFGPHTIVMVILLS